MHKHLLYFDERKSPLESKVDNFSEIIERLFAFNFDELTVTIERKRLDLLIDPCDNSLSLPFYCRKSLLCVSLHRGSPHSLCL